ncbi:hypothetical protein [Paraburkholderia acidisoli]|uniref:Uncharacterized protein n=1 Tax=Paraburkholderia acidisoli TaxID=2571748 RepID=A0A7Z2JI03_9BURK|nr:hypothetical protein [Paraburkholderia acidisoli]QGZ66397.1 hypothetical protein FAZ98_31935 [Paraburkholderia acidisoli]
MKVTLTGFLMAQKLTRYDYEQRCIVGDLNVTFSHYDSSIYNADQVVIGPHSFEVEVPDDFDMRDGLVANLQREAQGRCRISSPHH